MFIYVFTGGEHPAPQNVARFFREAPSYVVAADSGLDAAELFAREFAFCIDEIVGDMDSLVKAEERLSRYNGSVVRRFPRDKDYTDTELALQSAHAVRGEQDQKIVLIGGGGGRADHLFALKEICSGNLAPDIWLCGNQLVYCLNESKPCLRIDKLPRECLVSVFQCGIPGKDCRIVSEGLHWPLERVDWAHGQYSLSNRGDCEDVSLHVRKGAFVVIVSYPTSPGLS